MFNHLLRAAWEEVGAARGTRKRGDERHAPFPVVAVSVLALTLAVATGGGLVAQRAQPPRHVVPTSAHEAASLAARAIDLTYPFDEKTIYWPTDKSFRREKTKWGPAPGGYWYASATYAASEHGGTHLDSPIHFGAGQATTDEIPLSRLIGPAVVIDITGPCTVNRDYRLMVHDLTAWEDAHGPIPDGAVVLVRTGWGRHWPDKARYLGTDQPGDTADLHFPGITREAAEWLVARKVAGVGIDTASLDHGPSRDFIAHRVLNGAGIYGLENVAQLKRLPATGATLIALPMKIKGGSGGPTRIIAILPQ
jgi:kynurenine formamidase